MVKYKIEFNRSAEKALLGIPKKMVSKIILSIKSLAVNPRPVGCRKLTGQFNVYRIRVGFYRIIYEIIERIILIKVLKIGHRKDVYRQ